MSDSHVIVGVNVFVFCFILITSVIVNQIIDKVSRLLSTHSRVPLR